jgi:uncharacterized protein YndB with AHSA1/START domain
MTQKIEKKIFIEAQAAAVWKALIKPDLIKRWMTEPEIGLQVSVDWTEGSIISMRGFHHIEFENKGIVLKVDPENELRLVISVRCLNCRIILIITRSSISS